MCKTLHLFPRLRIVDPRAAETRVSLTASVSFKLIRVVKANDNLPPKRFSFLHKSPAPFCNKGHISVVKSTDAKASMNLKFRSQIPSDQMIYLATR